ncbi:MAG: hypothetical protein AUI36_42670, partial [Cyanobacteria bacterium 13_1_40CM_2_61_4]
MNYELYGLRIRSEVPLGAPGDGDGAPDFEVRWGEPSPIPAERPAGEVLAELRLADGRGYTHTRTDSGYVLRFHGTCEVRLDPTRRSAHVHLDPDADPGLVPILLGGNVLAFILTLAGKCVLHASAVAVEDRAMAFAGRAGAGKSTLAALLCAGGATLVTDDLLRLDPESGRCFWGTPEIRLRQNATTFTRHLPASAARRTADGRHAIQFPGSPPHLARLRAVLLPRPSRTCRILRLERLSVLDAAFRLTCCGRVAGWQVREQIRQHFEAAGRMAARIPVYEAEIPWGPPFPRGLGAALLDGVGLNGRTVEA